MSNSVNRVILIGNLTRAPELKFVGDTNPRPVCNINLATNEVWVDKSGQKQERVEYHRLQVWGKAAENAVKYLVKGSPIFIEGKIQTDKWTDDRFKNDKGESCIRSITKIVVERIKYLGKTAAQRAATGAQNEAPETIDEQMPEGTIDSPEEIETNIPL